MKKLLLSVMTVAFALAVQAGEGKACSDKDKAACAAKKASTEAKAQCPATAAKQVKATSGCCPASAKETVAKVNSPKGMEQAKR